MSAEPERTSNVQGNSLSPLQEFHEISARACLWFAFAPEGFVGPPPYNEQGREYLPVPINVYEYSSLIITQEDPLQRWRHDPSVDTESDANGRTDADSVTLQDSRYQDAQYNSQGITQPDAIPLNSLAGFFEYNPELQPYVIQRIPVNMPGVLDPVQLIVPPTATLLHLGFHDGFEWSNNHGTITFRIDKVPRRK